MPNSQKPFRILQSGDAADGPPEDGEAPMAKDVDAGGMEPEDSALSTREEIEQIKAENLTGRQLRIARRLAQRHSLAPTSDLDAVRLLRKQGIDPFARQEISEMMPSSVASGNVALPATVRKNPVSDHKPQPQVIDDDSREREVRKIQRGLVRRRRRRLGILMVKLAAFVALPSMIAGFYFYNVATPMYATYSQFVIKSNDQPGIGSGAAGLLSGTPFETATDSITVQGYLTSRDAMLRLDQNLNFRGMFQGEDIDVLQRLDADASNEDAFKIYKKRVVIGFDPTEGVIKMEVVAPDPVASRDISLALIGFAEERIEQLSERLRTDQMDGARAIFDEAEVKMEAALDQVAALQRKNNTINAEAESGLIIGQIGELEAQITQKQLELTQLEDNLRPNRTKLRVLRREIEVLSAKVEEKRKLISQGQNDGNSIVDINAELRKAEANLLIRQQLMAQALQSMEEARIKATSQTRYLSMGVSPVTPDQATYPRSFENTLLAVVIFAGLYLMISLTVSILREQVTT